LFQHTLALILTFFLSSAAFAQNCVAVHSPDCRQEIVLVRGAAGYWPGVGDFAEDLKKHGFTTRTVYGATYALEARRIAKELQSGRRTSPVTIVGYSSGADYACRMCSSLESRGVRVSTLILIESTFGTAVPGNVDLCLNLYESRPNTDWMPIFRGVPVPATGAGTQLVNMDVHSDPNLTWLAQYNHFTIPNGARLHGMLSDALVNRYSASPAVEQMAVQPDEPPETADLPSSPGPVTSTNFNQGNADDSVSSSSNQRKLP
jgi:hypothetical protein